MQVSPVATCWNLCSFLAGYSSVSTRTYEHMRMLCRQPAWLANVRCSYTQQGLVYHVLVPAQCVCSCALVHVLLCSVFHGALSAGRVLLRQLPEGTTLTHLHGQHSTTQPSTADTPPSLPQALRSASVTAAVGGESATVAIDCRLVRTLLAAGCSFY